MHRAQAHIQVKLLAQRHVERADTTAHRCGQRPLDGGHIVAHDLQRLVGQPYIGAIDLGGLFTGVNFHPVDLALAAIGLGHGRIHHLDHHRRDVRARAVAFNEWNDGLIRHVQRHIGVDGDLLAFGRHLDVLECAHAESPWNVSGKRTGLPVW
ncbi:hypothetical protein SDC9_184986 [bioreactor metagenome]|uniref:Uncharacterized protein n=1 Tax=bioreactor metagenome TaxID=1076179 RepID=A0A645HEJ9_9ZZZZ